MCTKKCWASWKDDRMTAPMICLTLVSIALLPGLMHSSSMTWDMVLIRSAPLHLMKMHSTPNNRTQGRALMSTPRKQGEKPGSHTTKSA